MDGCKGTALYQVCISVLSGRTRLSAGAAIVIPVMFAIPWHRGSLRQHHIACIALTKGYNCCNANTHPHADPLHRAWL